MKQIIFALLFFLSLSSCSVDYRKNRPLLKDNIIHLEGKFENDHDFFMKQDGKPWVIELGDYELKVSDLKINSSIRDWITSVVTDAFKGNIHYKIILNSKLTDLSVCFCNRVSLDNIWGGLESEKVFGFNVNQKDALYWKGREMFQLGYTEESAHPQKVTNWHPWASALGIGIVDYAKQDICLIIKLLSCRNPIEELHESEKIYLESIGLLIKNDDGQYILSDDVKYARKTKGLS